MRLLAPGRHQRGLHPSPAASALTAIAVAVTAILAAWAISVTSSAGAAVTVAAAPARGLTQGAGQAAVTPGLDKAIIARTAARARAGAAAAQAAARTYTVRSGDSISAVAGRKCGAARDWTGIYAVSRAKGWTAVNANVLRIGQHLWLSCAYVPGELHFAYVTTSVSYTALIRANVKTAVQTRRSEAATTSVRTDPFDGHHGLCGDGDGDGMDAPCSVIFPHRYAAAPVEHATWHAYRMFRHHTYRHAYAAASTGSYGNVSASNYSGFQACVISRESGGNSQVMNSSGHYGLYQFSASTWAAYGGSPGSFGHASVAQQNAVFANAMSRGGQSNWSPYDGC